MDLGPLRVQVLGLNMTTHGVPATVTRPVPDNVPIATRVLWMPSPPDEQRPYGTDLQRREPRRIMIVSRADVPTIPRGTTVVAPELGGGSNKTWAVDGMDRTEADHWRVLVTVAPNF